MKKAKFEKALIKKAQKGDTQSFEKIVRYYQNAVFNLAFQTVNNYHLAQDIAQETFLKVWRSLSNYEPRAKFSTWLFKIAKNCCFDVLRKRTKYQVVLPSSEIYNPKFYSRPETNPSNLSTEDSLGRDDLSEEIKFHLKNLSYDFKMVVFLKDIQGFSYREIAEIMDCPIGTVMSRLNRAHKILAERLRFIRSDEEVKNA